MIDGIHPFYLQALSASFRAQIAVRKKKLNFSWNIRIRVTRGEQGIWTHLIAFKIHVHRQHFYKPTNKKQNKTTTTLDDTSVLKEELEIFLIKYSPRHTLIPT